MKQLSDCCKAEIKLTCKDRPNAFACVKCGRIIGTPIKKQKSKELDWEKEFEIKYGRNSGRLTFYNEQKYYWNYKFYDEVKQFLLDQIQKAYYLGIQLGYTKHLKEELLLSIQSKGKIK